MRWKSKSPVGRASSRAGSGQKKRAARQEPRPTRELHEDPPPYRTGQDEQDSQDKVHPDHPANPVAKPGQGPIVFIDLFCGIGGFIPSPVGWERVAESRVRAGI